MAYYRTLKNGDRRLILTAKDKAVQDQRSRLVWDQPYGMFFDASRRSMLLSRKRIQSQIRYMWRYGDNVSECDRAIERINGLIVKWQANIYADLRYKKTGVYTHACSVSGTDHSRAMLNSLRLELKFWEAVKRNWYAWA